jgi:vitamin B12 transporter
MKQIRAIVLHLLLISLHPVTAMAQVPDWPDSSLLTGVEVVSSRLLNRAVGQRYVTLDSATLYRYAGGTLSELLSQQTPLDIRQYGPALGLMSARGGATSHTAFLWNGINLQNSLSGLLELTTLPLAGMQRVGYKTGGESALFGGGALSGVVFMDQDIAFKNDVEVSGQTILGSWGRSGQLVQLRAGNGRIAFQVGTHFGTFRNNFSFKNTATVGQPMQQQVNGAQETGALTASFFAAVSERNILKINAWGSHANRGIPPTMVAANDNANQQDEQLRGMAEWIHLRERMRWHTRAALLYETLRYSSNVVDNSLNRVLNSIVESEIEGQQSNWLNYRVGLNFTQNASRSNNFQEQEIRNRWAVFASDKVQLGPIELGLNMRQEWVNGRSVPVTGSVGAAWKLPRPHTQVSTRLRSSVARNYNLPAMNDLYWAGLGNPNLRPERSHSAEIGADWSVPSEKWALNLTFFALDIQDRILWSPQTDGIWRPGNISASQSLGMESALNFRQAAGKWWVAERFAYHYTKAIDADSRRQLLYVPRHNGHFDLSAEHSHWFLQFRHVFNGARPMTVNNAVRTQAFIVSGFTLQYHTLIRSYRLSLAATVDNLFNVDYQVIQYYPMPRRGYQLQFNWQWR